MNAEGNMGMTKSARRKERIRHLENGHGPGYLLNEAYKILGNPLVLFDMEYRLLACTENIATDDPLWNEIVGTGSFGSETIEFFKNECFLDTVAGAKTIALLRSDKLQYDRLYGRVCNSDGSTVSDLVMVVCHKPMEEHDPVAFEALCDKLSKEIGASEYYQQYGILYHEALICKLLDGGANDKVIYSDHLANLYEGMKTSLFVGVVDISGCTDKNSGPTEFRNIFKKMEPGLKYAVYANYIVIIMSTDDTKPSAEKAMGKLGVLFERNNIYAGVSSRFENMFVLRNHYDEAVHALEHGLRSNRRQRIFPYDMIKEDYV
jgi:hypothetical protein